MSGVLKEVTLAEVTRIKVSDALVSYDGVLHPSLWQDQSVRADV